jgi:hypothetical protein
MHTFTWSGFFLIVSLVLALGGAFFYPAPAPVPGRPWYRGVDLLALAFAAYIASIVAGAH